MWKTTNCCCSETVLTHEAVSTTGEYDRLEQLDKSPSFRTEHRENTQFLWTEDLEKAFSTGMT